MINVPYSKERWEKIPDRIRKLDIEELDYTDHDERELHKMELTRRLWISNNFLEKYTWTGKVSPVYRDEEDDEPEPDPQPGLEDFIYNA